LLTGAQDDFMENARLLVFETYCRIHQCIDLQMLADKLGMDKQAAETWVVNLIRNARLNAKIDSKVLFACLLLLLKSPAACLINAAVC
jgi:translation initiation factor 3 subunit E